MNAMFMCRLCAPLSFNYMLIALPPTKDSSVDIKLTTFYEEFGEKMLDLSFLGNFLGAASLTFSTCAPLIMLPYVVLVILGKLSLFTHIFGKGWGAWACLACARGGSRLGGPGPPVASLANRHHQHTQVLVHAYVKTNTQWHRHMHKHSANT